MLEPTKVWFVRAESMEPTPGRLSLETDALVFTPEGEASTPVRFRLASIRDLRRLRGSAVLQVTSEQEEAPLLFYFSKPPPLPGQSGRALLNPMRGLDRAAAGMSLRAAARAKRPLVDRWVRAIRDRMPR